MRKAVAVILAALGAACHQEVSTAPSQGVVVTFQVVNETFRTALTQADQIQAAREAMAGGRARIPSGRIVSGTDVNRGWSWHWMMSPSWRRRSNSAMDGHQTSSGKAQDLGAAVIAPGPPNHVDRRRSCTDS
jgi:hypothetical protein